MIVYVTGGLLWNFSQILTVLLHRLYTIHQLVTDWRVVDLPVNTLQGPQEEDTPKPSLMEKMQMLRRYCLGMQGWEMGDGFFWDLV